MTRWFGAAVLAATMMFGGAAAIDRAAAAPSRAPAQKQQLSKPTDLSARRHDRHRYRYADRRSFRSYYPAYYDRPFYYAPAPFFPFLGLGYGPWW